MTKVSQLTLIARVQDQDRGHDGAGGEAGVHGVVNAYDGDGSGGRRRVVGDNKQLPQSNP